MTDQNKTSIFSLTEQGRVIAHKVADIIGNSETIHRTESIPKSKSESIIEIIQNRFQRGNNCIFIGAIGIIVRAIAPVLAGKRTDPPVVVIDEEAKFVIPLLSSHEGGGGALAYDIAEQLGAHYVLTSQTNYAHPVYALGIGCDRNCPVSMIESLYEQACRELNKEIKFNCIGSIDIKAQEQGISTFVDQHQSTLKTYPAIELRSVEHQLSQKSNVVFREVGCYGVAEAAALLAASALTGQSAELILNKIKNQRATLAIARSYLQSENKT